MIGLDTNVLVRFLTMDDARQGPVASRFLKSAGEPLFVNTIVLCELVWVLSAAYKLSKELIADAIEKLLLTEQLEIEESDLVWTALEDYRNNNVDFSDCLIGKKNEAQGCSRTVTFDRNLAKLKTFTTLR
jgi:predicted nucleic-acid-binding protein